MADHDQEHDSNAAPPIGEQPAAPAPRSFLEQIQATADRMGPEVGELVANTIESTRARCEAHAAALKARAAATQGRLERAIERLAFNRAAADEGMN